MDERAVEAVVPGMELEVEAERVGHQADDPVAGHRAAFRASESPIRVQGVIRVAAGTPGHGHDMIGRQAGPLGRVEPDDRPPRRRWVELDGPLPRSEHDSRGLRIAVDVPLRDRGRVAGDAEGATHAPPAAQQGRQPRLEQDRQGEVRQRPKGDQGDPARMASRLVHDDVGAESPGQRQDRIRRLRVAQAMRTMRLRRDLERAQQRQRAARRHGNVAVTGQLQHRERVARRVLERGVAGAARHGDEVGLGARTRVQQRERVVDAGVDVEDERDPLLDRSCGSLSRRSPSPPARPGRAAATPTRRACRGTRAGPRSADRTGRPRQARAPRGSARGWPGSRGTR